MSRAFGSPWRARWDGALALLALALLVGGGGVSAVWGNLAVQLLALGLLAGARPALSGFPRAAPRPLALLVLMSALLPLVQLVPLPAAAWSAMPGRDLLGRSLGLAGGVGWYPLSLAPARTLLAFTGLIAPIAMLVLSYAAPASRLVALQRAAIGLALAIGLFGATHLINSDWGDLYGDRQPMPGILVGTFADRTAASMMFVIALLLLAGLPGGPRSLAGWMLRGAAALMLALFVILTGSRTGMVLLLGPLALLGWRCASWYRAGGLARVPARRIALLAGAGLLAAVAAGASLAGTGRVQASLARFHGDDGMRAEMREDARAAAARYWPAGAGMGTFSSVFQIDESLEYVSPRPAGRAHMEYLEVAIEAGLTGLLLIAGWLGWIVWAGASAVRQPNAWPARAAALGLLSLAAQSLLAFPLRNQAMLCLAALLVALLARSPAVALRPETPA